MIDGKSAFTHRGHTLPPPAQYVLDRACDNLVARGVIAKKNVKFIQALAGGGSLVKAVADGQLQAFEFAPP